MVQDKSLDRVLQWLTPPTKLIVLKNKLGKSKVIECKMDENYFSEPD